ncbi:MAG: helix-turn-helix domain-containing protein [Sphaerochaetaceae bacterium]
MRLHNDGVPATKIAKEFNVTAQTVRNWLKREKSLCNM